MTIRPNRVLLRGLTGAAAAAALVVPAAALAQTAHHRDPAKDVQRSSGQIVDAPTNKTTDIVHVTISHSKKTVSTAIKLRKYSDKPWTYLSQIKTPSTKYIVAGSHTASGTQFALEKDSTNKVVKCDGLGFKVKPGADAIVVNVPSSCLKHPAWVQVGVGYITTNKSGSKSFADDGLRKGGVQEQNLTLSKKLRK
jgi:hypothetical protein